MNLQDFFNSAWRNVEKDDWRCTAEECGTAGHHSGGLISLQRERGCFVGQAILDAGYPYADARLLNTSPVICALTRIFPEQDVLDNLEAILTLIRIHDGGVRYNTTTEEIKECLLKYAEEYSLNIPMEITYEINLAASV